MGSARSTGCNLVGEPRLALGRSLALWTVVAIGNSSYHYLFRTAFRHPRARRIALIQHEVDGYGDYVTGLAGDGSIVAYSQVFVASETIGDTDYFWSDRGAVKRVRARSTAVLARGNPPALLAVGGGRIAYVVADRARRRSPRIRAAATGPIIVDTGAGSPVTRVSPGGRVRALAVTASRLAALVVTPAGRRIERYALPSGSLLGTTAVPRRTASLLSASGHVVAFSTGTRIRRLDLRSGATRSIARVRGALVGLAVSGRMLVWAENRGRHGRVRSLALR